MLLPSVKTARGYYGDAPRSITRNYYAALHTRKLHEGTRVRFASASARQSPRPVISGQTRQKLSSPIRPKLARPAIVHIDIDDVYSHHAPHIRPLRVRPLNHPERVQKAWGFPFWGGHMRVRRTARRRFQSASTSTE
jgi:hypothetical protein